ncbi:MAG: hypothetical protein ACRDF5_02470 [bacterium]
MSNGDVKTARRQEHLAHHIGFAERWLVRARQEVARGDLGRGLLTLLLAEAEVHHARSGAVALEHAANRPSAVVTILGASALAAALLVGLAAALPQSDIAAVLPSSAPVMIRFKQPVGSTLALIPMVVAPAPAAVISAPSQVSAAPGAPRRLGPRRPPVRSATAAQSAPAIGPAPLVLPVLLSDGDLIDLVLAAERSLRGENR